MAGQTAASGDPQLSARRECICRLRPACGSGIPGPPKGKDQSPGRRGWQTAGDHNFCRYRRACKPGVAKVERDGSAPADRAGECGAGAGEFRIATRQPPALTTKSEFVTADERLANAVAANLPVKWIGLFSWGF